ncbi:hypothetical protein IGI04_026387 [Brassica rapa subsp. trilocularis]|uniref:Serine aminopeptidase S33 domain-containing protein n=1 Tax=Brassica rapa subsp. trilocularis TaxID=1813537 RepID=A0ABQ7KYI8_BRACM|nr:hypothetical protein IGI04_026387 [Brassica rapa subsp. trilocularis]
MAKETAIRTGEASLPLLFRHVSPGPGYSTMQFRLFHFWDARKNIKGGPGILLGIEMLMIDAEGTLAQGFIGQNRRNQYEKELQGGRIYTLTNFYASNSKVMYHVADQRLVICISHASALSKVEEDIEDILTERFRIHSFSDFEANCDLRGDLHGKALHQRPVLCTNDGLASRKVMVHLQLKDFRLKFDASAATPTVLLITTVNPKSLDGKLCLSSMSSSKVFLDEKVDPTKEYLAWLVDHEPFWNPSVTSLVNPVEVAYFDGIATIDDVNLGTEWYYIACKDCQTKLNRRPTTLLCLKCGNENATTVANYRVELSIYDNEEQCTFIILGDAGKDLTGRKATELINAYVQKNGRDAAELKVSLLQCFIDTIGHTKKFRMKVAHYNFTSTRLSLTATKIVSPADLPPKNLPLNTPPALLVNFIIRPPRAEYDPEHDLLEKDFMMKGRWYQRKDLEIKNSRGDVLQCSHYMPVERPEGKPLPCVIYCHGNSGCRADGSEAAIMLLPSNITVFTLDFSGSGLSGGEHVTLGWNEKDDLKAVVEFLRQDGNISLIGLWGRSMGAVTSLMYGAEDPSIAGMILDSPFSDLVDLMMELVDTYKFRLPKFTVKFAIQFMRRAIQKKAKFDITDLNTIKVAKSSFVPVLFGHALDDDFIRPHHSDLIYEAYVGDKNIIKFEGDHNSPRPQFYFDSINIFFHNVLRPPEVTGPTFYDPLDEYLAKGSWGTMHDTTIPQSSVQKSLAGSSISEAINEVRVKRPMSRTDVPSNVTSNGSPSETKEKENHDGREDSSSSPDMISFDLSNGDHDQYPPQLAMALDDDQYLEYHLEDIPSNAEEEERMLMKAVMESLKDLEVQSLEKKEFPEKRVLGSNSFQTAQEALLSRKESTSTQANQPETTDTASSPATVGGDVAPSSSESKAPNGTSDSLTSPVDASVPGCTSQEERENGDMSADTKATVTVERTSSASGKVFDGLIRKWDLNFFKNNK